MLLVAALNISLFVRPLTHNQILGNMILLKVQIHACLLIQLIKIVKYPDGKLVVWNFNEGKYIIGTCHNH
jgi:hypothetical protein